jgi:hypothetical protein
MREMRLAVVLQQGLPGFSLQTAQDVVQGFGIGIQNANASAFRRLPGITFVIPDKNAADRQLKYDWFVFCVDGLRSTTMKDERSTFTFRN